MRAFWRILNAVTVHLSGHAPWWVLLETTGSRTGARRRTPLANGPVDGGTLTLLAVYGESAAFVRNIRANPTVRIRRRGRWHDGTVDVREPTPEAIDALGTYARRVLLHIGTNSKILQISLS